MWLLAKLLGTLCLYYGNFRKQDVWFEHCVERKIPASSPPRPFQPPALMCAAVEGSPGSHEAGGPPMS